MADTASGLAADLFLLRNQVACPQLDGFFSTCYHPNGPAKVVLDDHSTCDMDHAGVGCAMWSYDHAYGG